MTIASSCLVLTVGVALLVMSESRVLASWVCAHGDLRCIDFGRKPGRAGGLDRTLVAVLAAENSAEDPDTHNDADDPADHDANVGSLLDLLCFPSTATKGGFFDAHHKVSVEEECRSGHDGHTYNSERSLTCQRALANF